MIRRPRRKLVPLLLYKKADSKPHIQGKNIKMSIKMSLNKRIT